MRLIWNGTSNAILWAMYTCSSSIWYNYVCAGVGAFALNSNKPKSFYRRYLRRYVCSPNSQSQSSSQAKFIWVSEIRTHNLYTENALISRRASCKHHIWSHEHNVKENIIISSRKSIFNCLHIWGLISTYKLLPNNNNMVAFITFHLHFVYIESFKQPFPHFSRLTYESCSSLSIGGYTPKFQHACLLFKLRKYSLNFHWLRKQCDFIRL